MPSKTTTKKQHKKHQLVIAKPLLKIQSLAQSSKLLTVNNKKRSTAVKRITDDITKTKFKLGIISKEQYQEVQRAKAKLSRKESSAKRKFLKTFWAPETNVN
jgi:hypothetical protein